MVNAIRNIEEALGDGIKRCMPSELDNLTVIRQSIVTSCAINKGEILSAENLTTKRPGHGISPMLWNEVIGQKAKRNFKKDELLET